MPRPNTHFECTKCPFEQDEEISNCPRCGSLMTEIYDGPEEDDDEPDDSLMQR